MQYFVVVLLVALAATASVEAAVTQPPYYPDSYWAIIPNMHNGFSSMVEIPIGSQIHVNKIPFDQIKAGDIVVFTNKSAGCDTCHLTIFKIFGGWQTRGTNNRGILDFGLMTRDTYHGLVDQIIKPGLVP